MRRHLVLLLTLLISINVIAKPVEQKQYKDGADFQATGLHQDFKLDAYIDSFKNKMADYVSAKYRYITNDEIQKIKATLDESLHNFSKDLKETLNHRTEDNLNVNDREHKVKDNSSDEVLEEIKEIIKDKYDEIGEDTANEIVYILRKNLISMWQKLDQIIKDSKRIHSTLLDQILNI